MGLRNTCNKRVTGLIYKLWDIQWDTWDHMNSVLHDTPLAEIMKGTLLIDRSSRMGWRLGFTSFPNIVKVTLPTDISYVIEEIMADKKGSAALVRKTR